ncbi:unnamed protein product [Lactuca saligna]|uniref:PB1-like domain-containing protein n=1 Tax=Lactuca saligna TaxID=75948 RepID=A0AA35Z8R5_LACSI|nr:unnamed protein product [Lactuca saligna]
MTIFLSIKVHFQGVFINKPFCYSDGVHHVFENVNFAGMSYNEFVGFLERFTQEKCEKVYYCQPDLQIPKGLTLISNERQYQEFIDIAYECGVQVSVYMDHFGTTVHVTKANENENKDNCYVKSNMSIEGGRRWIGSHFTPEVLENQKFNVRMLKEEGIIEAVKDLFPEIEHRQCAKHVLSNFKKKFLGAQYEKLFWKACKASTEPLFNSAMKEIRMISPAAYVHLMGRNPNSWSRAFFQLGRGCDARMCNLRQKGSGWGHFDVCPNIRIALNELNIQQRYWQVLPSGLNTFETRNLVESSGVDLEMKICSFRIWQMNGMNGSAMWPLSEYIPPLPPLKRKMPGRPTIKRKRDRIELTGSHGVSKAGKTMFCGVCKKLGHNKSTCDVVSKPQKSQVKKRKAKGEGESSALKKRKGQGKNGKGKGESDTGSGIGYKMGESECESTSGVTKKYGKKVDTLKLRKKSDRILNKKLAKRLQAKNGEGDTSSKPMDLD